MEDGLTFLVKTVIGLVISAVILSIPALYVLSIMFTWILAVRILLSVLIIIEIIAVWLAIMLIFEEV